MADVSLPKTSQTGTNEWADVEDNDTRLLQVINKDYHSPLAEVVGMSIDSGSTRRDYATVATEETVTSLLWDNPTTPGPSVTITVPSNSLVMVAVSVDMHGTAGSYCYVGIYESTDRQIGANPASDLLQQPGAVGSNEWLLSNNWQSYTTFPEIGSTIIPATAGTRTYTLKYATSNNSNAAYFKNRKIWAMALGGF